jgi:hypothetical protein
VGSGWTDEAKPDAVPDSADPAHRALGMDSRSVRLRRMSVLPVGTRRRGSGNYVVRALQRSPALARERAALWAVAVGPEAKKHNGQMDVVVALWDGGLLAAKP